MKNTVTLVGFVGHDPEVRNLPGGQAVTSVSLATSRSWKDSEGRRQNETDWHRVTCFNGIGKAVAGNVKKGAMIMVTGRIHYTRWTDSEGHIRHGCEIIAGEVDFLARGKTKTDPQPLLV